MNDTKYDVIMLDAEKLFHQGEYEAAYNIYRALLTDDANKPETLFCLAQVCNAMFMYDEAIKYSKHLAHVMPHDHGVLYNLGYYYGTVGDHDEALKWLKKCMECPLPEKEPERGAAQETLAQAYYRYVASQKFSETPEMLDALQKLYKNVDSMKQKYWHAFATAKVLNDLKEYDDAWKWYQRGNDCYDGHWSPDNFRRSIDRLLSTGFPGSGGGDATRQPVFIVGLPRSGTSITERILDSHADVVGRGERSCIQGCAESLGLHCVEEWPEGMLTVSDKTISEYCRMYLTGSRSDAARTVDKHPINYVRLPLIRMMFPNSTVIHTVRDPLDTLLSCYQMPMTKMQWSFDTVHLGLYYKDYRRLMDAWEQEVDLCVNYEELVSDQEKVSKDLVSACGLEWDDACLHPEDSGGACATSSHHQTRQKVYKSSVGRHKNYPEFTERIGEWL